MERHFDEVLKDLSKDILRMGAYAEEAIYKSIEALKNRDREMAQNIITNDNKVDELELAIDEKCIDLIATHQPMASDLRFITTGMKLNAELERIADIAVDIAQRVLEIVDKPFLKPLEDLPRLAVVAQNMVKMAIDSFIKGDVDMAKKVLLSDPEADRLRNIYKRSWSKTTW